MSKSKGGPQQSEKQCYIEEQRKKLKQFVKPGDVKVDADMFASNTKTSSQSMLKGEYNIV